MNRRSGDGPLAAWRRIVGLLAVGVLLTLAACAGSGPVDDTGVDAGTTTDADTATNTDAVGTGEGVLPSALTASLSQPRLDVAAGLVRARITNGSGAGFTVREMRLESTGFASPMTSELTGIVIGPGRVVDLPVKLGEAVCSGEGIAHEVHLDYEQDGEVGSVVVPAVDDGGRIADLHAAECFVADTEDVAVLSLEGPLQERELDGVLVADLRIEVAPQGGPGALDLVRVRNTTLLQHVDPTAGDRQPDGAGLEVAVAGEEESQDILITLVPARCDAHAVAEDKQGTRFRVDVELDGSAGIVTVAAPPDLMAALYDFVQRSCGAADLSG